MGILLRTVNLNANPGLNDKAKVLCHLGTTSKVSVLVISLLLFLDIMTRASYPRNSL